MSNYAPDADGARDRLDAAIAIAAKAGKRVNLNHYYAMRDALAASA